MEGRQVGDFLNDIGQVNASLFILDLHPLLDVLDHDHRVGQLVLLQQLVEREGDAPDLVALSKGGMYIHVEGELRFFSHEVGALEGEAELV